MLTILSGISQSLVSNHGNDFLLVMPPFGGKLQEHLLLPWLFCPARQTPFLSYPIRIAFICLQFGLTQAPAAQPRTCLMGQLLSMSIALTISTLPLLPTWFKQALATSLAIGLMTRCGLTHPPAGASAFLFSSGMFGISHMILLLCGNVLAIFLGSVINNMSEKRQYPTYYAMGLNVKDAVAYLRQ